MSRAIPSFVRSIAPALQPPALDKLGLVIAAFLAVATTVAPFVVFRANRIAAGETKTILEALPPAAGWGLLALLVVLAVAALVVRPAWIRLALAVAGLVLLAFSVGSAAVHLTPPGNRFVRVAPAAGFWIVLFALAIQFADAGVRLRLGPAARLAALALAGAGVAAFLASGAWNRLSILVEYAGRSDVFWREGATHLWLAVGSLAAALAVGLPLGVFADRVPGLRTPIVNALNVIQTVPSIALFGILIAPLGWLSMHVPGAAALGIRGIGAAPAFVALFLYSLLPMVANTLVGLARVPRAMVDAARGMGMTGWQCLLRVELPLALPLLLTGVRIVLVQNIGLATVAALIGGGGFGTFVFQGVGQTATDLILLGAVPTVALAFTAATVLDAAIELTARTHP